MYIEGAMKLVVVVVAVLVSSRTDALNIPYVILKVHIKPNWILHICDV